MKTLGHRIISLQLRHGRYNGMGKDLEAEALARRWNLGIPLPTFTGTESKIMIEGTGCLAYLRELGDDQGGSEIIVITDGTEACLSETAITGRTSNQQDKAVWECRDKDGFRYSVAALSAVETQSK